MRKKWSTRFKRAARQWIPVTGRDLLDTNVVIAFLEGDPAVRQHVAQAKAVFVPSIVLGELYFGAFKSTRTSDNLARIDAFAATVAQVAPGADTARIYGAIKAELRRAGRPIPENDLWIAALAKHHNLTLVTRDQHFAEVGALLHQSW